MGIFRRRAKFVPLDLPRYANVRMFDFDAVEAGGPEHLQFIVDFVGSALEAATAEVDRQNARDLDDPPDLPNMLADGLVVMAVSAHTSLPPAIGYSLKVAAHAGRSVASTEMQWGVPAGKTQLTIHNVLARLRSALAEAAPEGGLVLALTLELGYFCRRTGRHPYQVLGVNPAPDLLDGALRRFAEHEKDGTL